MRIRGRRDGAHREDDIAVSLVEVAMGTQGDQAPAPFSGRDRGMGRPPFQPLSPASLLSRCFGTGDRAGEWVER